MKFSLTLILATLLALSAKAQVHEGQYQKNLVYTGPTTGDKISHTLYLPRATTKQKDSTKKSLHNPSSMTEGGWGQRTWAFIDKHMP